MVASAHDEPRPFNLDISLENSGIPRGQGNRAPGTRRQTLGDENPNLRRGDVETAKRDPDPSRMRPE